MLQLHGYLIENYENLISLSDNPNDNYNSNNSIPESIMNYYNYQYIDKGLGQRITTIPNCRIRAYFTSNECTLEEAEELVASIFDGTLISHVSLIGWSEWTITGLDVDEFSIGGHNLDKEFRSHMGEYCWIIIEN